MHLLCVCALAPAWLHAADLAIVIDDVGYSLERGQRVVNLPGQLTLAVLPFAPHTDQLVRQAVRAGKDVIVHQPMEPQAATREEEERGTLKLAMQAEEFNSVLDEALAAVPYRSGLSNHTGSLLTQHREPMARLMSQLSWRGLYFLDSRTTAATVALDMARQMGVPAVRRDVFLDHHRDRRAIHQAFEQALRVARYQGHAVLVGHPYPMSLDYLEQRLTDLPADIRLVSAGYLAKRLSRPLWSERAVDRSIHPFGHPSVDPSSRPAVHQTEPDPQLRPASPHISPAR
ncbi:MAG: divergent polysaccharide deacetylase family protein [Pseudomonadota bacterium]